MRLYGTYTGAFYSPTYWIILCIHMTLWFLRIHMTLWSFFGSQYSVHHTRLRESSSGYLECNVRASEQIVSDITSLGTQEMRVLYSPGFINQVQ